MLFEDQTTNPQTTPQTTEDWLAKVVEAKGETFKDVQVLAKSKLESDRYIKELEEQAKALREELTRQDYSAKLLEQLQNKAPNPTNGNPVAPNQNNGSTTPSDTKPETSEDILKALVEKTLTERETKNTAEQNAAIVRNELVAKYGTEAKSHVERKAQELGMSYSRLEQLAQESPNAFLTLIGEPKKDFKPLTQGTINTQSVSMQTSTARDWNYYQNLRRTNKTEYFKPSTQQQMLKDKLSMGDKFGN
jgi:rubrerythrin